MGLDPRFGVAGAQGEPEGLYNGSFYGYNSLPQHPGAIPLLRRNPLPDRSTDLSALPGYARLVPNPRPWYLVGNEPNNMDPNAGDACSPQDYCEFLHQVHLIISSESPASKLAGPGLLNNDEAWAARMVYYYKQMYGSNPPLDAWAFHTYNLSGGAAADWNHDIPEVMAARAWINREGLGTLPIWITEFGAVRQADEGATASYLDVYIPWLQSHGYWEYGVARWFFFEHAWEADSPASHLVDRNNVLTLPGTRFRDYAYLQNRSPRPVLDVQPRKVGPGILNVTVSCTVPLQTIDRIEFGAPTVGTATLSDHPLPHVESFGHYGSTRGRPTALSFVVVGEPPFTVPFTIFDNIGPWQSLVGMGS